ncbi:MAG: RluA family pseudouridine synthase [Phycisphaerales bacterium]|nr:RluA family pseudouridine synthase [Phycisphaerales bacterium]
MTECEPLLKIVHATDRYAVVDKPPGLLSVPGKGEVNQDCVSSRARRMFSHASGPMVVHRLDMDTSGLIVVGLDADAQRELSMQFEQRRTSKRYIALVDAVVESQSGVIDLPMRADIENRPMQIIDHAMGRPSVTKWSLRSIEVDRSRLELEPITGRTHQLRVHLAAAGMAILGDVLYGPQPRTRELCDRLCLHACTLGFLEPGKGEGGWVEFHSPPPF